MRLEFSVGDGMETQRDTEALDEEPELFARALSRVAIVLAIIACAVYAVPVDAATMENTTQRFATR